MSAWLLIMWVSNINTFTLAVDAQSQQQCEKLYIELSNRFSHADHVCMKRPPAFSRALSLSNKIHSHL